MKRISDKWTLIPAPLNPPAFWLDFRFTLSPRDVEETTVARNRGRRALGAKVTARDIWFFFSAIPIARWPDRVATEIIDACSIAGHNSCNAIFASRQEREVD